MKELNHPLVSIITPGWNGKQFVHRLLDSVLAQTYDRMEYIYVDDGSTDGTKEVVLSYKEKFEKRGISFNYIYKDNGGLCSAIQEGLKHVKGEVMCWPEYDDILLPTVMERRVKYLETHPDCGSVTCDAWITPENDLEHPTGRLSGFNPNRFDRNHFTQLLLGNSIFTAACHMVRMDAFDDTHPNRVIYWSRHGAIWQMLLPVYYKYNRGYIDEPLVKWVVRSNSISHSSVTKKKTLAFVEECFSIRKTVLNSIEMPQEDRLLYLGFIRMDRAKDYMRQALIYHDKKLFYQGFEYYKDNGIHVTKDIRAQKLQIDHVAIYYAVECWRWATSKIMYIFRICYHNVCKD